MRAGRILRQIVRARIIAQVPALTGVYDKATESSAFPYASIGPSYWNDEGTECFDARSIVLQVDVWHSSSNKGVCEDLTDDVSAALDRWSDDTVLTMHPLRVFSAQVQDDPDGMTVHGIIQVEAMVESDG